MSGETKYFCGNDFAPADGMGAVLRNARLACRCTVEQIDSNAQRLTHNSQPAAEFKSAARGRDRCGWRGGPGGSMRSMRPRLKQPMPIQMRLDRAGSLYKAGCPLIASAAMPRRR